MRTTSTNKLPFATLNLASGMTDGVENTVHDYSVRLVEQFNRAKKKRSSRLLPLLKGSALVGSLIGLMKLIPPEVWNVQLVGLSLTVLLAVVAQALLFKKRVAHTKVNSLTNSGETAENIQMQNHQRLRKQNQVLMALARPQTLNGGNFHAAIERITAAAAEAIEAGQVSVWLYNKDFSQLECIEVYDQSSDRHWQSSDTELRSKIVVETDAGTPRRGDAQNINVLPKSANRWDVPIWLNEKRVGVVCYEHLKPTASPRTDHDENFADAIANIIALVLEMRERKQDLPPWYESAAHSHLPAPNSTEFISRLTPEGIFLYTSSACRTILGYEPDELVGQSVYNLCHAQDVAALRQFHSNLLNRQPIAPISYRIRYQSGNYIWLETTSYPLHHPDNAVLDEIVVVSHDITQNKQDEVALLERMRFAHTSLTRLSTLAAEVGVALANGGTLLSILQLCTDAMVQQLSATSATIWILNPTSQKLEQQAASGQRFPLQSDLIDLIAQTRQPYWSSDETEDRRVREGENSSTQTQDYHPIFTPGLRSADAPNVANATLSLTTNLTPPHPHTPGLRPASLTPSHHFSGYPLVVEDRLIGIMTVLGIQPLSEEARDTLSWVASAIGVAIDRYWARSELLTRRESLLFDLANQIRNSLELETILETAVQSIRNLFKIDRCHFLWYRANEGVPYWEVVHEARNPILDSHIGRYEMSQVRLSVRQLLNQKTLQIDEVETLKNSRWKKFLLKMGYTSLLSVPTKTHHGVTGVLSCGHCTGSRPWDDSEVELLQAVVAQLAIALDQAELYAQARQAACEAQAKARELEQTLRQLRTTQAQLVQSEKMSSLGQLVAGVAHEINNPVNFIHGNLAYAGAYIYDLLNLIRLYQEYCPNPAPAVLEQAELINIDFIATDLPKLLGSMQRGTDRIRSIVQSLRNFSRADEADMKRVDVHEGIESTLLILQHQLKAKGQYPEIKVFKEYGDLPGVECYPGELNQVFMNILLNAIEALKPLEVGRQEQASSLLPHSSPAITIRTQLLDSCETCHPENTMSLLVEGNRNMRTGTTTSSGKSPQRVVIQIADNGPGMTESVRSRLFDPFFTTKPVGQGIGLGLSISYQIVVEHHHGILTCTSAPGKGTEFWIEIPIVQSP